MQMTKHLYSKLKCHHLLLLHNSFDVIFSYSELRQKIMLGKAQGNKEHCKEIVLPFEIYIGRPSPYVVKICVQTAHA